MEQTFTISDLRVNIGDKPILRGIDLEMKTGEIHALMGPNGSGKSTLANVLMGHPAYSVTGGHVLLNGQDFLAMRTAERALAGIFLAFQYPVEIPGVTVGKFLKRILEARHRGANATKRNGIQSGQSVASKESGGIHVTAYIKNLRECMSFLQVDPAFINRYLNEGFSGGEKKRMEIVQMLMVRPAFAILDETDSGLDIDALKLVAQGVNRLRGEAFGALIITHYQRILDHIRPDYVHILYRGRIVTSGGTDLVELLEARGYDWIKEQYGIQEEAHGQPTAIH
jgi:Fe-S cluster assembly ATP-binding protein